MPDRPTLTRLAPAKLNLALAVGPPQADGMHPICSWMVTVGFGDDLTVTRLEDDRLSRYAIHWHEDARRRTEIDWSVTRDLAVRAHLALERHTERRLPIQLLLEKRIPVGGGLGGGSSNAATMLHLVNRLFELGLDSDTLADIGATLGSDVPFLVHGGSAIVAGLGERIDRHSAPPELHAVLVLPDTHCPTGAVYARFDEDSPGPLRADAVRALASALPMAPSPETLFNDLASAAALVSPGLAREVERVATLAERPAHVSGSGSTIFVLCDDAVHAEYLGAAIERELKLPALACSAMM